MIDTATRINECRQYLWPPGASLDRNSDGLEASNYRSEQLYVPQERRTALSALANRMLLDLSPRIEMAVLIYYWSKTIPLIAVSIVPISAQKLRYSFSSLASMRLDQSKLLILRILG